MIVKDPEALRKFNQDKTIKTSHKSGITSLTLMNDEALGCCGKDGNISIFDIGDSRLLTEEIRAHNKPIRSSTYFNREDDGKPIFVTGGEDHLIKIWDASNYTHLKKLRVLKGHHGSILNLNSIIIKI